MIDSWVYSIPGWLTAHEGQFLYSSAKAVRELQGDVVEIGSFQGKSTIFLAKASTKVVSIDPHEGNVSGGILSPTYKAFIKHLTRAGIRKNVRDVISTSKEAVKKWNKPISYLFIDGLHDEAHAREDYELWSPYVVDGGIVAMHDAFCGWEGARNVAMEHIVRSDSYNEIGVVGSIIFGVKGKPNTFQRIIIVFRRVIIDLCQNIYVSEFLPKWTRFILVHKLLRILLLNRFSTIRQNKLF